MNAAAYFDRDTDIVWIPTGPNSTSTRASTVEQPWGLVNHNDGTTLGIEIWNASSRIPRTILDALPEPRTGWPHRLERERVHRRNTNVYVSLRM